MSLPISSRTFSGGLTALLIFNAVSAYSGAVLAIVFDGAGVPQELLEGTWFPTFLGPGLILGLVVGGTQATAAFALLTRRHWALLAAAVAGFAMLIWIFTQVAVIGYSWLQSVYFGLGTLELILVLALLGIAPSIVSPVIAGNAALKGVTSSSRLEAGRRVQPPTSRALRDGAY
ncbi:MAG: hypothetical protein JWM61_2009 [Micrococcaceae bacterium]|nr:hypothetical protein [Micrococcaceae bacterium]